MENKTILAARVQALEHSIYGNGAIGMKEQLREVRENQKKIQRIIWLATGIISVLVPVTNIIIKLMMG